MPRTCAFTAAMFYYCLHWHCLRRQGFTACAFQQVRRVPWRQNGRPCAFQRFAQGRHVHCSSYCAQAVRGWTNHAGIKAHRDSAHLFLQLVKLGRMQMMPFLWSSGYRHLTRASLHHSRAAGMRCMSSCLCIAPMLPCRPSVCLLQPCRSCFTSRRAVTARAKPCRPPTASASRKDGSTG